MTKAEKVSDILQILDKFFPDPKIPLDYKDAYTLLIATLLSAQCTDERVNKTTPALFSRADNPYDMVKMSVDEIRDIIRPCGLSPMKSKGIHGLSRILIDKYNGAVPDNFEDLEALPAVGHKTASVVMTQWFGYPAFPVDTHIHRLAYRWGLTTGKSVEQTEKDLKRLIPQDQWDKSHLQIIYFGRTYCPARGHLWRECPVCSKYLRKESRD
ncbi:MAG TPA: endonuclease III [Ohtaekwangia sp.]|nr:endonuclease III [Ohtaekwangia sp.]